MSDDSELLRRYARDRAHEAFAELVRRHVDLVYAVALRQVGNDVHLAKDVTQTVFTALARKAGALAEHAVIAGWLYRATRFAAVDVVRAERRRRAREAIATTMMTNDGEAESGAAVNWDAVRPVLDEAIAELGDTDRDAVVLRYLGGCSFAEVGARLRLSENAARMRVERALAKLQALLARRGVRSTAAAVAMAVGTQVSVAAPPGLAAAVAGGATLAVGAGAGSSVLTGFAMGKAVTAVTGIVAAAAIGVVVVQRGELEETAARLAEERERWQAHVAKMTELQVRLRQVERRAAEAERDNGELLKAVEAARSQAQAQARVASVAPVAAKTNGEDERLARERAYQQELARTRAQEAIAQAKVSEEAGKLDALRRYERLLQSAQEHLANARFSLGARVFNEAMAAKPGDVAVTAEVKQLQAELAAQNRPVELALASDGATFVSIQGARAPMKFVTTTVKIMPGNYEVVGRRSGYEDVVIPLQVRAGIALPAITVICGRPR